jgi:hypothetical protein
MGERFATRIQTAIVVSGQPLLIRNPFADTEIMEFHIMYIATLASGTSLYVVPDRDITNDPLLTTFTLTKSVALDGVIMPIGLEGVFLDITVQTDNYVYMAVIGVTPPTATILYYWERATQPTKMAVMEIDPAFPDEDFASKQTRGIQSRQALKKDELHGSNQEGHTSKVRRRQV